MQGKYIIAEKELRKAGKLQGSLENSGKIIHPMAIIDGIA